MQGKATVSATSHEIFTGQNLFNLVNGFFDIVTGVYKIKQSAVVTI